MTTAPKKKPMNDTYPTSFRSIESFYNNMTHFFSNLLKKRHGSYTSISTMDSNDVIRDAIRASNRCNDKVISGHTDTINSLCTIRPGMVLSGSRDKTIRLTNADVCDNTLCWKGTGSEINRVAYRNMSSKHSILSGSRDSCVNLWLFSSMESQRTYEGHRFSVTGVDYVGDNNFVSGGRDSTIRLWDLETSKNIRTIERNRNLVTYLTYNPYFKIVAQTSEDKTVKIWDPNSLNIVHEFPRKQHIQMHCLLLDDCQLISCSNGFNNDGCELTVYDIRNMKLVKELRGHEGSVTCMSVVNISDVRKILVSVGDDKTIRIWKYEDFSLVWTEESPFGSDSLQVVTYPDGHIVISGGGGRLAKYVARFAGGRIILVLQWIQMAPTRLPSSSSTQF